LSHNGMFRRTIVVTVLALVSTTMANAQTFPPDRDVLEKGEGGGMGMLAEMYGYPGPKHLLDIHDSLRMGPGQVQRIANLYDEMRAAAAGKGQMIIVKEEELEDLFGSGRADEPTVRKLASEIGRMRGDLRAVHLTAHLKAWGLLTEEQRTRYKAIREAAGLQKTNKK
jgi:Spy/CpxP family protein refolding chaperone